MNNLCEDIDSLYNTNNSNMHLNYLHEKDEYNNNNNSNYGNKYYFNKIKCNNNNSIIKCNCIYATTDESSNTNKKIQRFNNLFTKNNKKSICHLTSSNRQKLLRKATHRFN